MIAIYYSFVPAEYREDTDWECHTVELVKNTYNATRFFAKAIIDNCYDFKGNKWHDPKLLVLISSSSLKNVESQTDDMTDISSFDPEYWRPCNIYNTIKNDVDLIVNDLMNVRRNEYLEKVKEKKTITRKNNEESFSNYIKYELEQNPSWKVILEGILNDSNLSKRG